jgi:hypothetical protein
VNKLIIVAALATISISSAKAMVINLSASPIDPNASPGTAAASGGEYTYNPVNVALSAGTYSVSVVGIAGGGLYDAWTINEPAGPGSYTDGFHFNLGQGDVSYLTGVNYNSNAQALAAYEAMSPDVFTLATATTVAFYLNDSAALYFADDSGGVSVGLTQVPEPASLALLAAGLFSLSFIRRRRASA